MKNPSLYVAAAAAVSLASVLAMPAHAADEAAGAQAQSWELSAGASITSDYMFDGISQTDSNPAVQGYLEATFGMFYAGIWASNVNFLDEADVEVDYYGGVRREYGKLSVDLGILYYAYYERPAAPYDAVEILLKTSYALTDKVTVTGNIGYVPEWADVADDYFGMDAGIEWAFYDKWSASANVGASLVGVSGSDYIWWNAGVSWTPFENVTLDVRYWDNDIASANCAIADTCDARIVATLSVDFSLTDLLHPDNAPVAAKY
ncbi:MAG: hypothetical protein H6878_05820 [Rhodobiaceae bacterium]|nr:hypothetical protein [Rhodobiaceae bacterium]MCC0040594.1 hypothetical protein [Rhodobiaceae bacterium]MCC0054067.1 hypothetical protein [Rhodobiaceae bacterium]